MSYGYGSRKHSIIDSIKLTLYFIISRKLRVTKMKKSILKEFIYTLKYTYTACLFLNTQIMKLFSFSSHFVVFLINSNNRL